MNSQVPSLPNRPLSEASSAPVIRFDDVEIGFDHPVLEGISFELPRGETKILMGVSGTGKTLALKLALGLLKPDAGRITVLDQEVSSMRERDLFQVRRNIGMVFQESALFDSLNVEENVAYQLIEETGHVTEEIHQRVVEALRFVELEHTVYLFPSELSGGMRRRVGIARAIITNPEVLLYDSPTGGLDPVTSNTIIELIVKQRDLYQTSALMVTHRLQDAFTLATHEFDQKTNQLKSLPRGQYCEIPMSFLILRDGKVTFDGDIHQLAHTKDEYIREYIS